MALKEYWAERTALSQAKLTNKNIKNVNKQLRKYYTSAMKRTISDFESTYDKYLNTIKEGQTPTPADLYKLDKYWKMQGQLKIELQKLGDKQASAMSKVFETQFFDIYYSIAIPGKKAFTNIDRNSVLQLIQQIWCADGKNFNQRIWGNTNKLIETLNEELLHCVITGKDTNVLKGLLKERFSVSYNTADRIVRTEMAHIQNTASKQRYEDYGLKQFEVWADKDERRCDVCGKLHQKKYPVGAASPVPAHPNCRCTILPVID